MFCHKVQIKFLSIVVMLVMLSACFELGGDSSKLFDFDLSMHDLEFQVKQKYKGEMTPAKLRSDRLIHSYIERNAMAEAIQAMPDFNRADVEAEVRAMRNELIINRYLNSITTDAASDEQVKAFYDQNPDKFKKRKIKLAQIYFRTSASMKPEQRDAIKSKAQSVLDQISAGEEFAKLAAASSEDKSSAANGGDIGWLSSDQGHHPLIATAMNLKESEVSPLIETNRGIYIVKALEGPIDEEVPFDSVKAKIAYDLKYQNKVNAMGELKKKAADRIARDYKRFQIQK